MVSGGLWAMDYSLLLNGLRYGVALVIPWLYFNLPNVKLQFLDNTSIEDVTPYDTTF
jgi:hypothetical protein